MAQGLAPPVSAARGEEFRDDLRTPGALNAQARKALSAQELLPFTQLDDVRSLLAMAQTGLLLVVAALLMDQKPGPALVMALVVSLLLLGHFASSYIKKGAAMPAIPMIAMSVIGLVLSVLSIVKR